MDEHSFRMCKKLPTAEIDEEALKKLEHYILHDVPQKIRGVDEEKWAGAYGVQLWDDRGHVEAGKVEELFSEGYLENCSQLRLESEAYKANGIVELSLFLAADWATKWGSPVIERKRAPCVEIQCVAQKPRQVAQEIAAGIGDVLSTHQTGVEWARFSGGVKFAVLMLGPGVSVFAGFALIELASKGGGWRGAIAFAGALLGMLLLGSYALCGRWFKPVFFGKGSFEKAKEKAISHLKWGIGILVGAILCGVSIIASWLMTT